MSGEFQVKSGNVMSKYCQVMDSSGQVMSVQLNVRSGQCKSGQVITGQVISG